MTDKTIEKLYTIGENDGNKFRVVSDYITKHYVHDPTVGPKLTQEGRNVISECMAMDMAIGANFRKNHYILTGIVIGIAVTTAVILIRKEIIKRKA